MRLLCDEAPTLLETVVLLALKPGLWAASALYPGITGWLKVALVVCGSVLTWTGGLALPPLIAHVMWLPRR